MWVEQIKTRLKKKKALMQSVTIKKGSWNGLYYKLIKLEPTLCDKNEIQRGWKYYM